MQTRIEILEIEALKLTATERAKLAERLIASLDEDAEVEGVGRRNRAAYCRD